MRPIGTGDDDEETPTLVDHVAAVSGGLLHAQDIAGTWQGTLTAPGGGPALRIVGGSIKGGRPVVESGGSQHRSGRSADQCRDGHASGLDVQVHVPAIGGNYEGRISDGNTISGNWTQGGAPGPLNLAAPHLRRHGLFRSRHLRRRQWQPMRIWPLRLPRSSRPTRKCEASPSRKPERSVHNHQLHAE